jgi:hypothetical protein
MAEITTVKRLVPDGRSKVVHALFVAGKGLLISVAKTFYVLWLETTGLIFAAGTVMGASALVRQYHADHFADHKRFLVVSAFTLVFAWFTVFSYVKARRTRK